MNSTVQVEPLEMEKRVSKRISKRQAKAYACHMIGNSIEGDIGSGAEYMNNVRDRERVLEAFMELRNELWRRGINAPTYDEMGEEDVEP